MEKVVLDNYTPKNGIYFRIGKDGKMEHIIIKRNQIEQSDLYHWIKKADYYSSLIDMNKPIDTTKKIHSNNYYSLFIKCDILPEIGNNKEKQLTYEQLKTAIENYFNIFMNEKIDKKTALILESIKLEEIPKDKIIENRNRMEEKIKEVIQYIKENELSNKEYVKLFLDEEIEKYRIECNRYTLPRIFNKNDFNIELNNQILGLSNDNMGLNSKKPYLELKTTKFKVPYRISLEDAIVSKRVFEWLNSLTDEKDRNLTTLYIPIDFEFNNNQLDKKQIENGTCLYIHKVMKNGRSQIDDFELVNKRKQIDPIIIKNYLQIEEYEEQNIESLWKLEEKVDEYYYSKRLINHYYNNDITAKIGSFSDMQVDILLTTKQAMLNYFRKNQLAGFIVCLDKVTLDMIIQKFVDKEYINLRDIAIAMNFRLNLLRYYKIGGKESMGDRIQELNQELTKKINSEELVSCNNEEEFFYAAGQLVAFLISKSAGQNKMHNLTVPFLQISTAKKLKDTVATLFEKYGYAVSRVDKRVNNLIGMVMGYETKVKAKDYQDLFISGICSKNMIYTKKEEEKKDEE